MVNPYKQEDNRKYYERMIKRKEMNAISAINRAKLDKLLKENGLKDETV